jgi:hypothetical protein
MSLNLLPLRLAGLALLLSVVSASAADDVVSQGSVARDSAPAAISAQPATPVTADAGKPAATPPAEKTAATDLGAARTVAAKRVIAPTPRVIRHATPQHARLGCSGAWCGRQFVLMLGVAY